MRLSHANSLKHKVVSNPLKRNGMASLIQHYDTVTYLMACLDLFAPRQLQPDTARSQPIRLRRTITQVILRWSRWGLTSMGNHFDSLRICDLSVCGHLPTWIYQTRNNQGLFCSFCPWPRMGSRQIHWQDLAVHPEAQASASIPELSSEWAHCTNSEVLISWEWHDCNFPQAD